MSAQEVVCSTKVTNSQIHSYTIAGPQLLIAHRRQDTHLLQSVIMKIGSLNKASHIN